MGDYPVIYWLVVAIVAGAVSVVLIGIGYLLGLQVALRQLASLNEEFQRRRSQYGVLADVEWRS